VADLTFDDVDTRVDANVRRALRGGVWLAPEGTALPTTLTVDSTGSPGTPTLNAFGASFKGLGWLDDSGAVVSSAVTSSDVTGWGGVEPVRRDIISDVTTFHIVGLESRLSTMATYFSVDPATITADSTTGEVSIQKPTTPVAMYYAGIILAVDGPVSAEIYQAYFCPRISLTDKGDQAFASGDGDQVKWDMTLTAYTDATAGYAVDFRSGGAGWQDILSGMGFS
jgi:hypothetical protein